VSNTESNDWRERADRIDQILEETNRMVQENRADIAMLTNRSDAQLQETENMKVSILALRDILVGQHRDQIRVETGVINLESAMLTFEERLRALELWRQQTEGT
jgi:pantothenate synthetase